jgi:alpha-tubulin suppressor-like RCC1 family protein
VSAWGLNAKGQLGLGTTSGPETCVIFACSRTAKPVAGVSGAVAVAAGAGHSLALRSDGSVLAWGENKHGQLGDGTESDRSTPAPVSGLSGVVAIAAGYNHGLALLADGTVRAWGENEDGQLGDGTTAKRLAPVPVSGLSGVVAIAAGAYHSLALRSDGTVMAWGWNREGQLGLGTTSGPEKCGAAAEACSTKPARVGVLDGAVAIAAGYWHSLALLSNGTVAAWGGNFYGQLGDGTETSSPAPVAVSGLLGGVTGIAAGYYHSLALLSNGTVAAWGENAYAELGDGTEMQRPTPVPVSGLTGAVALSAGFSDSSALRADGSVMTWGDNTDGELGTGSEASKSTTPIAVTGLGGVTALAPRPTAVHMLAVQGAFAKLSSTSLTFAAQTVGTASAAQAVTVTNAGPAPLAIAGETVTGTGAGAFHKTQDGCAGTMLAAGAACQIGFSFKPISAGPAAASVAIQTTAANTLPSVSLVGTGVSPPPLATGAGARPVVSDARESHRRWRVGRALARFARAGVPVGTTFSLMLNEQASLRFAFTRRVPGRRVGRRCVAQTGHNRHRAGCLRTVTVGALVFAAHADRNTLAFQGRLTASRTLAPGRYRALLTATNAAGKRSNTVPLDFTIVSR